MCLTVWGAVHRVQRLLFVELLIPLGMSSTAHPGITSSSYSSSSSRLHLVVSTTGGYVGQAVLEENCDCRTNVLIRSAWRGAALEHIPPPS